MADKKINFEIAGKGWRDAKTSVDAVTQSLEKLKKAGVDIGRAFQGRDLGTITGISKLGKEVFALQKNLTGLSKQSQEFIKAYADKKVQTSIKQVKEGYQEVTKELDKLIEKQKELGKLSIQDETKLLDLMTRRYAMGSELTSLRLAGKGGISGFVRGAFDTAKTRLGRFTPFAAGGAIGGAAGYGIRTVARGVLGRREEQAAARTSAASYYNARAIEALTGNVHREVFMNQMGQMDFAEGFANRLTTWDLASQGMFGSAALMGMGGPGFAEQHPGLARGINVGGALGLGGLAAWGAGATAASGGVLAPLVLGAGAAYLGLRGVRNFFRDPKAAQKEAYQRRIEEGREHFQRRFGIPIHLYDEFMARAEEQGNLQRLIGEGIYGTSEIGLEGPLGGGLRAGFGRGRTVQTMLDMAQVGGARATRGHRAVQAMFTARRLGVEQAAPIMARLGQMTDAPGGRLTFENRMLRDIIAEGFIKGLDKGEMKVEREAYVDAVMAASERIGRTNQVGAGFSANMARTFQRMLPGDPTLLNIETAQQAFAGRMSLAQSPLNRGIGVANAFRAMETLPSAAGLPGDRRLAIANRLSAILQNPEMITADNPELRTIFNMMGGRSIENIDPNNPNADPMMSWIKNLQGMSKQTWQTSLLLSDKDIKRMKTAIQSGKPGLIEQVAFDIGSRSNLFRSSQFEGRALSQFGEMMMPFLTGMDLPENYREEIRRKYRDQSATVTASNQVQHQREKVKAEGELATLQKLGTMADLVINAMKGGSAAPQKFAQQFDITRESIERLSGSVVININNISKTLSEFNKQLTNSPLNNAPDFSGQGQQAAPEQAEGGTRNRNAE